ncbi:MAG: hypothetical protein GY909_05365 [Oligoflexia bacterium]|nr:hypothetical protein [Oligoflexia bacterium]
MKKNHIVILFLFIIGIGTFFAFFNGQNVPDTKVQAGAGVVSFEKVLDQISRTWMSGASQLEQATVKKCTKEEIPNTFYQCNPDFLKCALQDKVLHGYRINLSKHGKEFKIYSKSEESDGNWPDYALLVELKNIEDPKLSREILLTDECRSLYLPRRVYHYGKLTQKWNWDNFDRHIFVDKHVVTNRDIREWVDQTEVKNIKFNESELHLPSLYLTSEQMENFCRYRGKKVLKAEVFDAISILPFDNAVVDRAQEFNSIVPWSRKEQSVSKAWQKIKKDPCKKAVSSECKLEEKELAHFRNPSWTGHYMVMGGYLEYMVNMIHPRRNLKVSSMYFERLSPWFRLGERAFWDGDGFSFRNFNWRGEDPLKEFRNFGVTFRCMKEQYYHESF